jgi:hypothetical protein
MIRFAVHVCTHAVVLQWLHVRLCLSVLHAVARSPGVVC